jgi:hypothetical protein
MQQKSIVVVLCKIHPNKWCDLLFPQPASFGTCIVTKAFACVRSRRIIVVLAGLRSANWGWANRGIILFLNDFCFKFSVVYFVFESFFRWENKTLMVKLSKN